MRVEFDTSAEKPGLKGLALFSVAAAVAIALLAATGGAGHALAAGIGVCAFFLVAFVLLFVQIGVR